MAASFGGFNPQATDPYPIEGQLAGQLSDPNASGFVLPWLNAYRAQNAAARGDYQDNLAQQHAFARDQLAAEMANNSQKNLIDAAGKGGGTLPLFAQADATRGLFSGASPGALDSLNSLNTREAVGKILQSSSAGAYSAAEAGLPISAETLGGVTGLQHQQGTPLSIQAANIHAASAGSGEGRINVSVAGKPGEGGAQGTWSQRVRPGEEDAAFSRLQGAANRANLAPAPGGGNYTPSSSSDYRVMAGDVTARMSRGPTALPGGKVQYDDMRAKLVETKGVPKIKQLSDGSHVVEGATRDWPIGVNRK